MFERINNMKTNVEKQAQGTLQKCRIKQAICFDPLDSIPDIPDHLNEYSGEFFKQVCELFLSNGSLTAGNIPDITLASIWWGVARQAEESINGKDGIVQVYESGAKNVSPYLSVLDRATTQIQRFSDRYGLSLLSKQRVGIQGTKKEDPFDKL